MHTFWYCGNKFGYFYPKFGDFFFHSPGHSGSEWVSCSSNSKMRFFHYYVVVLHGKDILYLPPRSCLSPSLLFRPAVMFYQTVSVFCVRLSRTHLFLPVFIFDEKTWNVVTLTWWPWFSICCLGTIVFHDKSGRVNTLGILNREHLSNWNIWITDF